MGWENVYPSNAKGKTPLRNFSIQVLVYDQLRRVQDIPADQWTAQINTVQKTLQQPYMSNLQKCAKCVALVWGVYGQMHSEKESMGELVKAMTAFVPTSGPASVGDLISMAAEVAKDYIGSYRNAVNEKIQPRALSQEQLAILGMLNPASWKQDETLAQWAEQLLDIGEYGIRFVQTGNNAGNIDQVNVDAMEEYVRVVRPMLYLYRQKYDTLRLTAVP
ncbi:hypothetical protein LC55x_3293 [Lysobacter capsici]|uniref:hypothetical protein n=1 Tax=Lysobacter capsici TaxID=435897 RepID=UPI000716745F|nr:hypothetical protein [Lysobacter capsici]ALN86555.1 hypothetical protein LC55x_3293 [Lysobacter capsici]ATE72511.1 hypothetical protein CNO08_14820 [Lysobacter capsici]